MDRKKKNEITRIPFSLSSIQSINSDISPFLSGEVSKERLKNFLANWPISIEPNRVGFECSLEEKTRWNDFHAFFLPSLDLADLHNLPFFFDPSWQSVINLPRHAWKDNIEQIRLELDLGTCAEWPPKPNLFFKLAHKADAARMIGEIFLSLTGKPLSDFFFSSLSTYLEDPFYLSHIGFMLGRSHSILLSVKTNTSRSLAWNSLISSHQYLEPFTPLLDDFPIDPLGFTLEISEDGKVQPKIGIGVATHNMEESKLTWLLEKLTCHNLISKEKKTALLSWKGIEEEPCGEISLLKSIYSIKFICTPNAPIWTKAYLSVERFSTPCLQSNDLLMSWVR